MKKTPKYSIIIPTYDGAQYLPTCIETIISQDYKDYELIISDDHSTDGTKEFLETLSHPNITVIYPPESLSMTEHWEWALSYATGEWQIFVGQDDGLQPYFFQLADRLTVEAKEKDLRTIMSSRAYFFWKGCEYVYGDIAVGYTAINKTKIHNFKYEAIKALLGLQDYFELPQMYTTSLFHTSLLDEARLKQNGKIFSCHPQDANLAAIACALEKEYLKSYVPLGWVGASPKSAGMAISSDADLAEENDREGIKELRQVYKKKIKNSNLQYNRKAGDFSFGNLAIYFWQALLSTEILFSTAFMTLIKSRVFTIIFFVFVLRTTKRNAQSSQLDMLNDIMLTNNISYKLINILLKIIHPVFIIMRGFNFIIKAVRFILRKIFIKQIKYNKSWEQYKTIDFLQESKNVKILLVEKKWISV